ncbi:hypothetical protein BHM03_00017369, partial [Ensete ventricosum]
VPELEDEVTPRLPTRERGVASSPCGKTRRRLTLVPVREDKAPPRASVVQGGTANLADVLIGHRYDIYRTILMYRDMVPCWNGFGSPSLSSPLARQRMHRILDGGARRRRAHGARTWGPYRHVAPTVTNRKGSPVPVTHIRWGVVIVTQPAHLGRPFSETASRCPVASGRTHRSPSLCSRGSR